MSAIEYVMECNTECAKAILDQQMSIKEGDDLILDFQIFDKNTNKDDMSLLVAALDNSPLSITVENDKPPIVLHPLLQIFLDLKFRGAGKRFIMRILHQLLLTICITISAVNYIGLTSCKIKSYKLPEDNKICFENEFGFNLSGCEINQTHSNISGKIYSITCKENYFSQSEESSSIFDPICDATNACVFNDIILLITQFLLVSFSLKEFAEILSRGIVGYVKIFENWIAMAFLALSIMFMSTNAYDLHFAIQCAGWMVFFAWIDFTFYLGRWGTIGKCIYMSIDVAKTMSFYMLSYSTIFCAFALGFYIFLHSNWQFSTPFQTFIGLMAMMIGDLNYDDNFTDANLATQIMFGVFTIMMAIIVMNLLIAVTLSETKNLQNRSQLMMARRKIEHITASTGLMDFLKKIFRWCWKNKEYSENVDESDNKKKSKKSVRRSLFKDTTILILDKPICETTKVQATGHLIVKCFFPEWKKRLKIS